MKACASICSSTTASEAARARRPKTRWRVAALLPMLLLPALTLSAQPEYHVGPQDILTIDLIGEPDVSGKYRVDADGYFTFPLIGRVPAAGMSVAMVEAELKKRLAAGYFKDPQLSVAVETYRSQRIFVVGEVERPGSYTLTGNSTSLLEALSLAGSLGAAAGDELVIVRPKQGLTTSGPLLPNTADAASVTRVDLHQLQAGVLFQGTNVQDGDTIFVPRAETIFVFGQVRNPGSFPIRRGMTVLQALALAGGLTERGSTSRLRIVRVVNGKRSEIKAKVSDPVQPGDTVIVRERLF
jgi:polysaccharide export outer membrane protein